MRVLQTHAIVQDEVSPGCRQRVQKRARSACRPHISHVPDSAIPSCETWTSAVLPSARANGASRAI